MKKIGLLIVAISLAYGSPSLLADGKHHSLPPGLEKNLQRGKPLPPGWQKKLSPGDILAKDIYARGKVVIPLGTDGSITLDVEGTLIKLRQTTREILELSH